MIRTVNPDVVGLQEADVRWGERSNFVDQAAAMATALGMAMRFALIYELPGAESRGSRQFCVAVLSRHPITGFTSHPLARLSTQDSNPSPRPHPGFMEAMIDVRGTSLRLFSTHLDYRRDPAVQRAQVARSSSRSSHDCAMPGRRPREPASPFQRPSRCAASITS